MTKKLGIICLVISVFLAFLIWLFVESSKPLPGTKLTDLGRGHVPVGEQVEYNSNPPTSGKHYDDWVRSGIYDSLKDDRNLVHSLEHGYVIMHYKCDQIESRNEATEAGKLDESCEVRQNQLAKIYEKKGQRKLIVVPRPNLETNYALTAWTYLDKFDPSRGPSIPRSSGPRGSGLGDKDIVRIEKFIDAHLNQGPEKTME